MHVEKRMDEFEKVLHGEKASKGDIQDRMGEFEPVKKTDKVREGKSSTLPFGIKRFKSCPNCNEMMEIQELLSNEIVYYCPECQKKTRIERV